MNIEEATEMLKRIYVTRFNTSSIYDNVPNVNLAIETLLKAYEKEKEKNKKLEKELENQQKGMKNWEEIYDEDQNYIGELNDKIFDLKFEVKNLQKEIEELNKSDASKEQSSMNYYNLYKELEDKIKAKIEELDKEYTEILKDYGNIDEDVIFQIENENVRKQLGEILSKIIVLQSLLEKE